MPDEPLSGDGAGTRDPRVLLYSQRNLSHYMWETPQAEFEDVICQVDDVHLVAPAPVRAGPRANGRLAAWATAGREIGERLASGVRQTLRRPKRWPIEARPVTRDYDLFFAVFHFPRNISVINRMPGLRERCRTMACFLIECWPGQIQENRQHLSLLDHFDRVFLFNAASIPDIQRFTNAPCEFLPTAADALRFAPYPLDPDRYIDVYQMGRGSPAMHAELLEMAADEELHYQHARVNHAVADARSHRLQVASILKRTRYFPAYRINENRSELTRGQKALATRFFEGAAAGTIMIGSAPLAPEFGRLFPYADAVIPVSFREPAMRATLAELDADPVRLARIRQMSVTHALETHDWAHRWDSVLRACDLPATADLDRRRRHLSALAGDVRRGRWFDPEREASWTPRHRRQRSPSFSSPSPG